MTKEQKLYQLREKIIKEFFIEDWRGVWFYPKDDGVMGWRGTDNIMFVGLNPATTNFGGFYDTLYYDGLKKFEFQNAHLTDVFKFKKTNKEARKPFSAQDYKKAEEFLKKEIEIINPKLIVLLGGRVEKSFKEIFPKLKKPIISIGHYSYRYKPKAILRKRWYKEMARVKREYKKLEK